MSNEYIALYTDANRASPYAHRVEIALAEAGVQPVIGLVDLKDKPEWFTTIVNILTQQVPTIAYGGPVVPADQPSLESVKLTDSSVLLEFIADIYTTAKLLPEDPVLRAKARFFSEWADSTLTPAWFAFYKGQGSKEALLEGFEAVQKLLPNEGFAVGEWSIADASIAPHLGTMEVMLREDFGSWEKGVGPEMYKEVFEGERFARLVKYWRDVEARESWKKTWNETKFVEFMKKRFGRS